MAAEANKDAFLCPAVQRFIELLKQKPSEFDIAILSDKESDNLADALVLDRPASSLGVNALDLPRLARNVRREYWQYRQSDDAWHVTKCLLLLCPDHATAWADRRRYLLRSNEQEQALLEEVAFLNLLMTKHTKAPSSWWHRKWVLERLRVQDIELDRLIREELNLCTMVAERYPKNYYAWTHRLYCVRKARSLLLKGEWDFVLAWLLKHVSDHSAVHYAGQVLMQMFQENSRLVTLEFVEHGMQEGRRLVQVHPAHEVLWIFRRVCAHTFFQLISEGSDDSDQFHASRFQFIRHIEEEWNEAQQSQRPKLGSELEFEWRKTRAFRLSYIAWIAITSQSRIVDNHIREQAVQGLRECDFIPYNLWRLKHTGL